ncbi:MAG: hypothetical protein Unbinned3138contig1002_23 [Prokaryotic dsDNA virus sp.]|nr:MAG: hypothetical protein Unbinned3138contig1002_23 [Prokaryotic dsDNA virus sp.]
MKLSNIHPTIGTILAFALWIVCTVIISFLVTCTIKYFMEDTKTQEHLDRYRKYYHLDNPTEENPDEDKFINLR